MNLCPYCGTKLSTSESCTCTDTKQKKPGGFNSRQLIILIITVILVVSVVAIALSSGFNRPNSEFDLSQYIIIDGVSGPNGSGVAKYHLDEDQLIMDILSASTKTEVTEDNFEAVLIEQIEKFEEIGNALSCITVSASQKTGLSNGDTVIVSAEFENVAGYDLSFVLTNGSRSFTVSSLVDPKTVDLFSDETISVTFSGISGAGEAQLEVLAKGEAMSLIQYNLMEWLNLSNGDTVTVKAIFDAIQLEKLGYIVPDVTEQTYTVSGLAEFFNDAHGLPEELLQSFCAEALAQTQTTAEAENGEITVAPEIAGMFFLNAKDVSLSYHDFFNGVVITNGVAVVTTYEWKDSAGYLYNRVNAWVFPNLCVGPDGVVSYDADHITRYFALGADPDNMPEWFRIEFFGYLSVTELP